VPTVPTCTARPTCIVGFQSRPRCFLMSSPSTGSILSRILLWLSAFLDGLEALQDFQMKRNETMRFACFLPLEIFNGSLPCSPLPQLHTAFWSIHSSELHDGISETTNKGHCMVCFPRSACVLGIPRSALCFPPQRSQPGNFHTGGYDTEICRG
jgi:hypothetical protein